MDPFTIKVDEQIKAKIHTETVMNFDEQMMWTLIGFSSFFEKCVHEKTYFSEKVHVRKSYDSCSRIGVREGSAKNNKMRNIIKNINNIIRK